MELCLVYLGHFSKPMATCSAHNGDLVHWLATREGQWSNIHVQLNRLGLSMAYHHSISQRLLHYRRQHFDTLISVTTHNNFPDFSKTRKQCKLARWLTRWYIDTAYPVSTLITIQQAILCGMIMIQTRQDVSGFLSRYMYQFSFVMVVLYDRRLWKLIKRCKSKACNIIQYTHHCLFHVMMDKRRYQCYALDYSNLSHHDET